jgi:hypothetical protein
MYYPVIGVWGTPITFRFSGLVMPSEAQEDQKDTASSALSN